MARKIDLASAGLRVAPVVGRKRRDRIQRQAENVVRQIQLEKENPGASKTFGRRVQASQGLATRAERRGLPERRTPDREGALQRAFDEDRRGTGVERRGAKPASGLRKFGANVSKAFKVSPAALGVSALVQPSQLGDATMGRSMLSPEQVRATLKKRRLKKQRAIPTGLTRGQ